MSGAALLLVNPNAGRVDQDAIDAGRTAVPDGWDVEVVVTQDRDEVPGVLGQVGDRRLLVMGGDGTLNVALGQLHRAGRAGDVPVGFVPAGTANAFARAMQLPLEPARSLPGALTGDPRPVDLLVSDAGHVAVNDLHTGLGVPATRVSAALKPVLRQAAYPVANSAVGLWTSGWAIDVLVDGEPLVPDGGRSLAVMVGNSHLIGDGTEMWPGARVDDGVVDVVVLLACARWRRVGLGLAVHRGDHLRRSDVVRAAGRTVVLRGEVPGHNADGELHDDAGETTWTVLPAAWRLRAAAAGSGDCGPNG